MRKLITAMRLAVTAGLLMAPVGSLGQTLTLNEAVSLAEANAPAVRAAAEAARMAGARVQQTEAAFFPFLRLGSSYTASDNPTQVFMSALNQGRFSLATDLNNPPSADNFQLSAQVGMQLFNGGRDWANRRAARAAEQGMILTRDATTDQIRIDVVRAYVSVLTATELLRAANASVRAYETHERVMSDRVATGTALKTELLNIQVEMSRAEERQIQSSNGLALAREYLRLAMGLDSLPYRQFDSLDAIKWEPPVEAGPRERPDIQAQSAFADAARAELRAAKGGYLPSLSAFAGIDRFESWKYEGAKDTWAAGLLLEWTVFDGFLTRATVREKGAGLRSAEEQLRQARLSASVESAAASSNVREAAARIDVMARAVSLASESANITRERFAQGLSLSSQVIDAESALVQAEAGLSQAKGDYLVAIATLRRALGLPIIGESNS